MGQLSKDVFGVWRDQTLVGWRCASDVVTVIGAVPFWMFILFACAGDVVGLCRWLLPIWCRLSPSVHVP